MGPGCCVCPWAAARPRAVRAASFARRVASKPGQAPPPPSISHVIPLRLVQTLNLHRWNCNVFAWSRKVTAGNYVRLLVSVGSAAAFGCWGRTLRPFMRSSSLRRWGFCTTRSLLAACRRRVEPSCSAIPPDWCRRQPRVSRLGPADQAARLSETPVAFAGAGRVSTETGIAFAGEKWVYLVRFSAALVTVVSTVAGQGRAVVMAVSYWPVSAVAVVLVVSMSPWCRTSRAKKFALRAQNTPNSAFLRSLGEFFHGNAGGGAVLGEFYRDPAAVGARGRTLLHRGPGGWASLLAVLTLQCAVKPYWWPGGQPAHAATYRVNVRMKGPRPPPIGLTCA